MLESGPKNPGPAPGKDLPMLARRPTLLLTLGLLLAFGLGLAQPPILPQPDPVPAQPAPDQLHATLLEVRMSLCHDIDYAAQILTRTGTLGQAIPVVMEMTGLQPAAIEAQEAAVCGSDPSALTPEELRAGNRIAVWLIEVHLAAMDVVLTGP